MLRDDHRVHARTRAVADDAIVMRGVVRRLPARGTDESGWRGCFLAAVVIWVM